MNSNTRSGIRVQVCTGEKIVERSARFVLRHRWWVVGFWLISLFAGVFAAGKVPGRLSFDFSVPSQPGFQAETKLAQAYGVAAVAAYVPVLTLPAGETFTDHRDDVSAVAERIRAVPGLQVLDYGRTGDARFLTDDGRSTFALVYAPAPTTFVDPHQAQFTTAVTEAARARGLDVKVTGYQQLSTGDDQSQGTGVLAETLLGGIGALIVLVFVFASFLALMPLLIAVVSILSTYLIVLGLTTFTDVSVVVQFLIALIGLGVAIDYSLRWSTAGGRSGPRVPPTTRPW